MSLFLYRKNKIIFSDFALFRLFTYFGYLVVFYILLFILANNKLAYEKT